MYYANCHRQDGTNFAWMQDNLTAATVPTPPLKSPLAEPLAAAGTPQPGPPPVAAAPNSTACKILFTSAEAAAGPRPCGNKSRLRLPAVTLADKNSEDATINSNDTTCEIQYLAEASQRTNDPAYRQGVKRGTAHLLKMQYRNGGSLRYYPDRSSNHYKTTYNDNAIIKARAILRAVTRQQGPYATVAPDMGPR